MMSTVFILSTAVALPNKFNLSISRVAFIALLYIAVLSISSLDILAMGSDVCIYNGLFRPTIESGLILWAPGKTLNKGIDALNRMFDTVPTSTTNTFKRIVHTCLNHLKDTLLS